MLDQSLPTVEELNELLGCLFALFDALEDGRNRPEAEGRAATEHADESVDNDTWLILPAFPE